MKNYLIIADDFTGANDTGVQIRRRGIPVKVMFSGKELRSSMGTFGSCVIDTESRFLSEEEAFRKMSSQAEQIPFENFHHVFKKVDSTLRGNIGAETKALANCFKPELVIFAPALPDLGRTTINSIHCLKGIPVCQTELAKDPKNPVKIDNIQKILAGFFDEKVTHIAVDTLRKGPDAFRGSLDTTEKMRIVSFDAETNGDLKTIIQAVLATEKQVLWVGSAGLADNLLGVEVFIPPALAVVASLSSVTRKQALYAEKQGVSLVKIPLYAMLEKTIDPEAITHEAVKFLGEGRDIILLPSSSCSTEEYQKTEAAARFKEMSSEAMGNFTQETIGSIALQILGRSEISGLFLSGGDTAISCFNKAGASGSEIIAEAATGIPLMRLRGGAYDGLKVITKAGAFGNEDAIFYALRKLREAD